MPWLCVCINPPSPNHGRREKTNLNFYFHFSFWCLKRFYEGLKGLHKTFSGTTKKCGNTKINLIFISIQISEMHGTGRVKRFVKDLLVYLKYLIMFDVANFVDIPCLLSFINV